VKTIVIGRVTCSIKYLTVLEEVALYISRLTLIVETAKCILIRDDCHLTITSHVSKHKYMQIVITFLIPQHDYSWSNMLYHAIVNQHDLCCNQEGE
jgi:hypothetical protein